MWISKLYSVVTLHDCMQDPATVAWLIHTNVPLPEEIPPGRYPSPTTIKAVIDNIPVLRANYQIGQAIWQVTAISRKDVSWGTLAVKDYSGNPEEPHRFYFSAGWDEVILLVASHLTKHCGPLVLLHESGAPPQVVI